MWGYGPWGAPIWGFWWIFPLNGGLCASAGMAVTGPMRLLRAPYRDMVRRALFQPGQLRV